MLDPKTKTNVLARLKRIEGQVAGINRMVEGSQYCVDVLLQISAVQGALAKVGQIVLGSHIDTCVSDAIASGNDRERRRKIDELMDVFARHGQIGR
ncbi:MAG: metal-sensitive transcriptional regulator [Planctomycetota bacterium]|jgi:DNA-binding FrmR family transcriptional regulator